MPRTFHGDAYTAFIEVLVAARLKAGITQAELAHRLGRHQSFVSNFEKKIRRLDIVETVVVCRAIGLDPVAVMRDLNARVASDTAI